MIKSYKFVLIIATVLVLLFLFFKPYVSVDDNLPLENYQLLMIGILPIIFLAISILLQKIVIAIVNSDAEKEAQFVGSEDKIWKIAFFVNLFFGIISFIVAIIVSVFKIDIRLVSNYGFTEDLAVFLFIILAASFIISTFFKIKQTLWEVNKLVGSLFLLMAVCVFAMALFFPTVHIFNINPSGYDETSVSTDSVYVDSPEITDDYEEELNLDYYSFNKMDFSEVKTGGYFEKYYDINVDENAKSQELLKLFLSKNLKLKAGQEISQIRSAIMYAQYDDEFVEINNLDEDMGRKPEAIREAFDSYKPLIYAFLNEKIYFESNLNLIVEALIASHDDISATENPNETMKKIHIIMNRGYKQEFPGEYFESLQPFMSEAVLSPLKQNAKKFEEDFEYNYKLNAIWIYSFWGRRFEEKNHEQVIEILQEINTHYQES